MYRLRNRGDCWLLVVLWDLGVWCARRLRKLYMDATVKR